MWSYIWHTFFFDPIYNSLVFFIDVIPGGDVGVAIILTTILVKVVLLPLSIKAAKTQYVMRQIEPELKALKEKFKDKREEQARAMMELYRKSGINPFASIFLVLLQLPIIISLYFSVARGGGVPLPEINIDLLYAFIPQPQTITMVFLGIIDITTKSIPLALLAGVLQFFHAQLTIPKAEPKAEGTEPSFKDDFARSLQLQMRYVMPAIIAVVAYTTSAAIAIYFTVSSITAIAQEYIVRKHRQG